MSEKLYDALEVCLRLMDEGASLDECLARYPLLSEELRPTLEAAYAAQCLTETVVPLEAMNRSRTRLLGKAAQLRKEKAPRRVLARTAQVGIQLDHSGDAAGDNFGRFIRGLGQVTAGRYALSGEASSGELAGESSTRRRAKE